MCLATICVDFSVYNFCVQPLGVVFLLLLFYKNCQQDTYSTNLSFLYKKPKQTPAFKVLSWLKYHSILEGLDTWKPIVKLDWLDGHSTNHSPLINSPSHGRGSTQSMVLEWIQNFCHSPAMITSGNLHDWKCAKNCSSSNVPLEAASKSESISLDPQLKGLS